MINQLIHIANEASSRNVPYYNLTCIMILYHDSQFWARWLTQVILDIESNLCPLHVCAMQAHVKIGASVHVLNRNTAPTQVTLTHADNIYSN